MNKEELVKLKQLENIYKEYIDQLNQIQQEFLGKITEIRKIVEKEKIESLRRS